MVSTNTNDICCNKKDYAERIKIRNDVRYNDSESAECNPAHQQKKMNIAVIGCGRWGSFIAWYLSRGGHRITIYGKKEYRLKHCMVPVDHLRRCVQEV